MPYSVAELTTPAHVTRLRPILHFAADNDDLLVMSQSSGHPSISPPEGSRNFIHAPANLHGRRHGRLVLVHRILAAIFQFNGGLWRLHGVLTRGNGASQEAL